MAQRIQAASSVWKRTLNVTFAVGGLLLVAGVALAFLPRSEETTIKMFTTEVTTTSLGAALACFGVILVTVLVKRTLNSVDRVTAELDQ